MNLEEEGSGSVGSRMERARTPDVGYVEVESEPEPMDERRPSKKLDMDGLAEQVGREPRLKRILPLLDIQSLFPANDDVDFNSICDGLLPPKDILSGPTEPPAGLARSSVESLLQLMAYIRALLSNVEMFQQRASKFERRAEKNRALAEECSEESIRLTKEMAKVEREKTELVRQLAAKEKELEESRSAQNDMEAKLSRLETEHEAERERVRLFTWKNCITQMQAYYDGISSRSLQYDKTVRVEGGVRRWKRIKDMDPNSITIDTDDERDVVEAREESSEGEQHVPAVNYEEEEEGATVGDGAEGVTVAEHGRDDPEPGSERRKSVTFALPLGSGSKDSLQEALAYVVDKPLELSSSTETNRLAEQVEQLVDQPEGRLSPCVEGDTSPVEKEKGDDPATPTPTVGEPEGETTTPIPVPEFSEPEPEISEPMIDAMVGLGEQGAEEGGDEQGPELQASSPNAEQDDVRS